MELCPRCNGKGSRELIVGPHIRYGQPFPGGPLRYDCKLCNGKGRISNKKAAQQGVRRLDDAEMQEGEWVGNEGAR